MNSRVFAKGSLLETEAFCLSVPPRQTKNPLSVTSVSLW